MSHKPAGGIKSRVNVSPQVRLGKGSTGIRPAYTNMPGTMQGNHPTEGKATSYTGERRETARSFNPTKYGNEIALNSKSAPGQGRTIYASGTQGCQGQPAPGNPPTNTQRDALKQE